MSDWWAFSHHEAAGKRRYPPVSHCNSPIILRLLSTKCDIVVLVKSLSRSTAMTIPEAPVALTWHLHLYADILQKECANGPLAIQMVPRTGMPS